MFFTLCVLVGYKVIDHLKLFKISVFHFITPSSCFEHQNKTGLVKRFLETLQETGKCGELSFSP